MNRTRAMLMNVQKPQQGRRPKSTNANCSVSLPSDSHDSICPAIDSTARNGETVARRRYQRGSVYLNKARTVWLGMYSEYVLDSYGVENRARRQVVLGPVRKADGTQMTKREAQRLLRPYVDRVNSSLSETARERKSATFEAFSKIWERDYLPSQSRPRKLPCAVTSNGFQKHSVKRTCDRSAPPIFSG